MLIVSEVRKSTMFSNEKPFAVVRFRKGAKGSKFAVGSLNDGQSYSLTYNLSLIYPEIRDEGGNFDAKEAYKMFKKEMALGAEEPVNGYDVPISSLNDKGITRVRIKGSDREPMSVMHPACYGDADAAKAIAQASFNRQIREKTFIPVLPVDIKTDEDSEDIEE
jgi:hypothetical protein